MGVKEKKGNYDGGTYRILTMNGEVGKDTTPQILPP